MSYLSNKIKKNFTVIPNKLLVDNRLSMGAKIVYCYLGSKPDGWVIINNDVQKSLDVSQQSLSKYYKELLDSGWISRSRIVDENNHFLGGFKYELFNTSNNENSHIYKKYIYGKSIDNNKKDIISKKDINNKEILTSEKIACTTINKPSPKKELNPLQEFSNEVVKKFEQLEDFQIGIWFKRNCRCLSDILKFCGGKKEDIPLALECINVCCDIMDKKGFEGAGYEAVCRNLPYYYSEAKKRLNKE